MVVSSSPPLFLLNGIFKTLVKLKNDIQEKVSHWLCALVISCDHWGKNGMFSNNSIDKLVCLGWFLRMSRDEDGRLVNYIDGFLRYFLPMIMCCAWVGALRKDDIVVSDGEADLVSRWIVKCRLLLWVYCWCWIKTSRSCSIWSSVIGLEVSERLLERG